MDYSYLNPLLNEGQCPRIRVYHYHTTNWEQLLYTFVVALLLADLVRSFVRMLFAPAPRVRMDFVEFRCPCPPPQEDEPEGESDSDGEYSDDVEEEDDEESSSEYEEESSSDHERGPHTPQKRQRPNPPANTPDDSDLVKEAEGFVKVDNDKPDVDF